MSRRDLLLTSVGSAALILGGLGYWLGGRDPSDPEQEQRVGINPSSPPEKFEARYDKCHALLIGIAKEYQGSGHAVLAKPVEEVVAIQQRLLANDPAHWKGSIKVLIEKRANKQAIEDELSRLESEPGREDGVLLYFSGHGIGDNHQWFLVPAGTTGPDPNRHDGYVDQDRISNFLDKCPAKHVLVVLDCCYAGTMFSQSKGSGRPSKASQGDGTRLAGDFLRERARQILGASNKEAADGPFCKAFLTALTPKPAEPRGDFVIADQLYAQIMTLMPLARAGSSMQIPQLIRRPPGQGSFVFFLP